MARRVSSAELDEWRQVLYEGRPVEPVVVRRLIGEVTALWSELARQRAEFAAKAASALEKRLAAVAAYNSGGCPKCHDAEARVFLAKLKRIAGEGDGKE